MRTFLFKGDEKAIFEDEAIDEALQNGWQYRDDWEKSEPTEKDVEHLENEIEALKQSNTVKKKRGRPKKS